MNDQPKNGCAPGSGVSDKHECKEACENLGITVPNGNWQNDGKPCLAISKKTCKQSNSIGNKAYRICKQEGKIICLAVVYTVLLILLSYTFDICNTVILF